MEHDIITMLEVIEHLPPHVLDKFHHVVFGGYQPDTIIISTPNYEFNVLFGDVGIEALEESDPGHLKDKSNTHKTAPDSNARKFRHWDHQFEWTRAEFQEWCQSVIALYPFYTVSYSGVGVLQDVPLDESIGHASQFAIFTRTSPQRWPLSHVLDHLASLQIPTSISSSSSSSSTDQHNQHNQQQDVEIEIMQVDTPSIQSSNSYITFSKTSFPYYTQIHDPSQQHLIITASLYQCIRDWPLFNASNLIPLHHLWSSLPIRQSTKTKKNLLTYLASNPSFFTIILHPSTSSSLNYLYSTSGFQVFFDRPGDELHQHHHQHHHQVFQIPHIKLLFPIPLPADFQQPPCLMHQDADADPDAFDKLTAAEDYIALNGVDGGGGGHDTIAASESWGDIFPVQTDFTWT